MIGSRATRGLCAAGAGFTAAAIVMTLPLWQHPTRRLPADLVDTLLNTWILGWDADRLRHGLQGLWDAPIYYPYHNTLAFSENLLGLAILVAPIVWFTDNPVLAYNVAFTGSFVLAGVGMYLLAARLTASWRAAVIAGTYYAFCPFRFIQISHIQLVATGWLPIGLYAIHRYFDDGARRWLALLAIAAVVQVLTNTYAAYIMLLPMGAVAADTLWRDRSLRRTRVAELTATAIVAVAILAPVAVRYYRARGEYGQVRRRVEMEMGSADVRSYVTGNPTLGIWRWLRGDQPIQPERDLFPGFLVLALAACCFDRQSRRDGRGRWVRVYAAAAALGVLLSLGPTVRAWNHVLLPHGPYEWLLRVIPGMDGMRVPSRFAVVPFLSLAVLAGVGAIGVGARLAPALRTPATALAVLIICAESWAVPLPVYAYSGRGRPEDRAVADWLRGRPPGAVLHQPVHTANHQELNYQFATLQHGHPIVNGMSGYDSPLQMLFRDESSPLYDADRPVEVVRMLRALGIRYVVVNLEDFNVTQLAHDEHLAAMRLLRASGQVVDERRFLDAFAFELAPPRDAQAIDASVRIDRREIAGVQVSDGADRAALMLDGDADTRWFGVQGECWLRLNLAAPADIAGVALTMAERSLADYPRQLQFESTDGTGTTRTVLRITPYAEFLLGFVRDPRYPRIMIALPPNFTTALTIKSTGAAPGRWWSVHEIELWKRNRSGP